jgi:hypothetical protein
VKLHAFIVVAVELQQWAPKPMRLELYSVCTQRERCSRHVEKRNITALLGVRHGR